MAICSLRSPLASKVGLCLVDAHYALEDFSEADKRHLLVTASDGWSGGVLPRPLPDGNCVCILNPNHWRRNRITPMEEIAYSQEACAHGVAGSASRVARSQL